MSPTRLCPHGRQRLLPFLLITGLYHWTRFSFMLLPGGFQPVFMLRLPQWKLSPWLGHFSRLSSLTPTFYLYWLFIILSVFILHDNMTLFRGLEMVQQLRVHPPFAECPSQVSSIHGSQLTAPVTIVWGELWSSTGLQEHWTHMCEPTLKHTYIHILKNKSVLKISIFEIGCVEGQGTI